MAGCIHRVPRSSLKALALSKGPAGIYSNTCWGAEVGGLKKEEKIDLRVVRAGFATSGTSPREPGVYLKQTGSGSFSLKHPHGTLFCSWLGSVKLLILRLGFPSTLLHSG